MSNSALNQRVLAQRRRDVLKMGAGALCAMGLADLRPAWAEGELDPAARVVIQKLSNALLGPAAGPLASGQLVGLLGLKGVGNQDYSAYFQAIQAQLKDIQDQLGRVERGLDRLSLDVLDLESRVDDTDIQARLRDLSKYANKIDQSFDLYKNATRALESTKPSDREDGAKQLYDLFALSNAQHVSIAMRNIQDVYLPRLSQQSGLIAAQHKMIRDKIIAFGADRSNFPTVKSFPPNGWDPRRHVPPNNEGWRLYSALPAKAHEIANNLMNSVVAETLRAFLTFQLKGMLLISSAWSGGINAGEVTEQAERNKKVMDELAAFPAKIAKTIDNAVADCLKTYGQHIGEPLKSDDREWHYDRRAIGNRNPRAENDMPYKVITGVDSRWIVQNRGYQLNDDYIIWDQVKEVYPLPNATPSYVGDDIVLLERPWELDNCRTVGVWGELQHGIGSDPLVLMVFRFPTNVARFPREAHDGLAFLGALS